MAVPTHQRELPTTGFFLCMGVYSVIAGVGLILVALHGFVGGLQRQDDE